MLINRASRLINTTFAKLGLGSLSVGLAAIIVIPVYARLLGPESLGAAEIGLALVAIGMRVLVLGLDGVVAIRINETPDKAVVVTAAAALAVLSGSLAGVGWLICAVVLPDLDVIRSGLGGLVALSVAALVLNTVASAVLRNLGRGDGYFNSTIGYSVALVGVGVGASIGGLGAAAPLLATTVAGSVGALIGWRAARTLLRRPLSRSEMNGQVRLGSPLVPAAFALTALFAVDRLIIGTLMTTQDVGQYAVAARIAQGATLLTSAALIGWLPYAMRHHRDIVAAPVFRGILDAVGGLAAVAILAAALLGRPVLLFVAGPGYQDGVASMWLLVAAIAFYAIQQVVIPGLMIRRSTLAMASVSLAAAAGSFAISWVAVPHLGISGAALGTAGGTLLLAMFTYAWAQRHYALPYRPLYAMLTLTIAIAGSVAITVTDGAPPAMIAGVLAAIALGVATRPRLTRLVDDLRFHAAPSA